ncbi:hypothetical protein [Planctomyces sp. SH-PL62]|uniref:hypothetical protein n=1 Tax=Planctomyces sp. SH-PL62 TaxID=1636152 RepID=UPI00078CC7E7|nr:hypothetical protein [Planctomyces sp. SH-PL62]AMV37603.1 hypothetical protein VT85_09210 [Planctomyces sp. SH-PL62]
MNIDDAPTLGECLIRVEPEDADLRRRYEEGKLALRERRLTPLQRALGWVGVPLNVGLALAVGWRLWTTGSAEPPGWAALLAASAAGLLAIGGWLFYVLLQGGRVTWRADRVFQVVAAASACGMAAAAFEVARSLDDRRAGFGMLGVAVVTLAGAGAGLAVEWARRARLETRVAALENELRLAELSRNVADLRRDRDRDRPGNDASPAPS